MKYLELWCLWDDAEVRQLLDYYLRWIWCQGVQVDPIRDLASKFPSAISKFTTDMSGDQLDGDIVVGTWHNLKEQAQ